MNKVAILTDSNSGITQQKAKEMGIHVIPMPFMLNDKTYFEDINLTQEKFFEELINGVNISTSQPAAGDVIEKWDELLKKYDEIIYIPMSSGLSTSCATAIMLAKEYDNKVQVANNHRISVTQMQAALDAKVLAQQGRSAVEIKEYLEGTKDDSRIYIMVDDLNYLKKGGRVTPAGAAIGSILQIKPVLKIEGDKLDAYSKARGVKQAKKIMIDAIKNDLKTIFKECNSPDDMWLQMAYTYDLEAALEFKREYEEAFEGYDICMYPLSLNISCHIGPGALALGCTKKMK